MINKIKPSYLLYGHWVIVLLAIGTTSFAGCDQPKPTELPVAEAQKSDSVSVTTHTYADKGESLELDVYRQHHDRGVRQPVVIFVHGGGFYTGTRKESNIGHFCDSLARAGFTAVNMDYRLFLKGESFHCDQPIERKIMAFATAVNDIRSATRWLLEQSDSLKIDRDAIFLAGSSAGAEAVLHAAYWNRDTYPEKGAMLPEGFRFKGVMAFAGALVDEQLITSVNALPTLLYHGSCDPLVPYDFDIHHYCPEDTPGALPLHGSYAIYKRMREIAAPVRLVTRCGGKHGSAVTPIENDINDILRFLRMCLNNKPFTEHEIRYAGNNDCRYGKWQHCD